MNNSPILCALAVKFSVLSNGFLNFSGVRREYVLSPFLYNFLIYAIMECSLKVMLNTGEVILSSYGLIYLDYVDDSFTLSFIANQ